jgi:NADH-quinone oxidoreductase subunit N
LDFTTQVTWWQALIPILPEVMLVVLAFVVLGLDLAASPGRSRNVGVVAGVGALLIMVINLAVQWSALGWPIYQGLDNQLVLGGMIRFDMLALIFRSMVLLAGGLVCLMSLDAPKIGRHGEYYAIVLVATLGMSLMSAAADLIMVFLALETTSISLYVLAGFLREDRKSAEAGIKYFLFGAFTSGLMLYGLSLLYGFGGGTNIYQLADQLENLLSGVRGTFGLVIALLLLVAGFGFKIAAVPFHFWAPDVYEGAPTPVTAFISTASKAASFGLLMRVFLAVWPPEASLLWTGLLAGISAVTMTLGNTVAIAQRNVKRMLAYSSIAQAGYALMGVVALSDLGAAAVTFYMLMYVMTNIAAFTVVALVANHAGSDEITDLAGLSRRSPLLSLAMVLALLSLGGIPPLAGFFGKFFLFSAAVQANMVWLAVLGVLNAIVALYYYLLVVKVMYVDAPPDESPVPVPRPAAVVLGLTCLGIVLMGTLSAPWFNWAETAAGGLGLAAVLR